MYNLKALFKENDKGKAIPELEHVYYPIEEDSDIKVVCTYLTSGEMTKYIDRKGNQNMEAIIIDHVKSIEGINITDEKTGKNIEVTPQLLLALPGTFLSSLIANIYAHIVAGADLKESEIKN